MTAIYVNYRKELINGFILVKMDKSIDHAYIVNIMQSNYLASWPSFFSIYI